MKMNSLQKLRTRTSMSGFTLIELVIVVAIIGILAAIAYPSYTDSIVKSRRKAAAACVLEGAQFMERFYTTNLRYDQTVPGGVAVAIPALGCAADLAQFYNFALTAGTTATTYDLSATPTASQPDALCGTLGTDERGVKSVTGTGTVQDCWVR